MGQESEHGRATPSAEGHFRLQFSGGSDCVLSWNMDLSSKLMGYWQNSVSGGSGTEAPTLLLAVSQDPSQFSEVTHCHCFCGPHTTRQLSSSRPVGEPRLQAAVTASHNVT